MTELAKGFGTQVCLANIVGITNIQNFITALNGADLRTWLVRQIYKHLRAKLL
jgi:hypothetical protein